MQENKSGIFSEHSVGNNSYKYYKIQTLWPGCQKAKAIMLATHNTHKMP